MKELLQHYKCATKQEVYRILIAKYRRGYTYTAIAGFDLMSADEQADFIRTLDPYDPVYTFFSTMGFAETV